ncbi:MAG: hypothetical protein AAGF87_12645, partial [Bacteroidota bacterium]
ISSPLKTNFWRALTDNDIPSQLPRQSQVWEDASPTLVELNTRLEGSNRVTEVVRTYLNGQVRETITYTHNQINQSVGIQFSLEPLVAGTPPPLRYGYQTEIAANLDRVSYHGLGPHENYVDRQQSAFIARHELEVSALTTPYIRPQENGNRGEVRTLDLYTAGQEAPYLSVHKNGDRPFAFSLWSYTQEELSTLLHDYELPYRSDRFTLNIDYGQNGVGGDDSWTTNAAPYPEHRLPWEVGQALEFGIVLR